MAAPKKTGGPKAPSSKGKPGSLANSRGQLAGYAMTRGARGFGKKPVGRAGKKK